MGSCTRRHFLLSTCFLQMITIIERQVFDFLGYMWAPILVNFFHILFIIFGFYGAYHFRIKYIITYLIWNFLWIGWNSFLICFYLNVGTLDRDSDLLNLGTGSVSWFEVNGYGCKPIYNTNITSEDPYRPLRPESVEDCLLTYDIVEVVHSGVQCILAFFGILGAILISYIFLDEDDRFDFMNGDAKSPQHTVVHPMYVSYTSIPTSASGTMLSNKHQNHTLNHHQHHLHHHPNHQQNTLSNSNNHLNNSTHAISTTTTPITTTTTSTTTNNNNNNNKNSCNTPLATKKKFSSSSLANSIQQQQQTSLHKQILTANATTATNNYNNNINNSNSISHSHSNSNRNSSNSNQHNNNISNSNTFLIHSHNSNSRSRCAAADISSYNGSLLSNASQYQPYNSGGSRRNRQHRNMSPSLSTASNSLTHILYSPKQGRKVQPSSSNSIFPANIDLAQKQPIIPAYYDDSTAKADHQLYVNGSRRQILIAQSPNQDTTPSLSYASLQNSTQNLNSSFKQNATPSNALSSSLSNSNYSLTNSLNNNQMAAVSGASGSGTSGHFARIHSKPKPSKSSSYSSFKHSASASNQPPDLKYNQIFNENSVRSNTSPDQQQPEFEECFEEDDFSVQNLKTDEGVTYIPFTKPTPVKHVNKKAKHRQSLYSIEFGPSLDTIRSRADTILDYGDDQMHERCGGLEADNGELSPKPMTPRRVKRRSVMHRGSNSRQSTASRRSSSHSSHKNTLRGESRDSGSGAGSTGTHSRSSTRSSRRKYHQNPVTKLLDQQQLQQQQSTMHIHSHHGKQQLGSFHHKDNPSITNSTAALTVSNLQSLNQEIHNNINAVSSSQTAGAGSLTKTNNNHYQSFRKNIPPDPIYYNTNAQTAYLQQQQWQQQMQQIPSPIPTLDEPQSPTLTLTPSLGGGHYNPTYQHSTTNLNDADHVDELYNNRPPSVRSSYSNFHGARSMSSYMSTSATTENVFVNLVASNTAQNSSSPSTSTFSQQQQQQQQQQPQQQPPHLPHESPATPPLYQQHPLHQQHTLSQHSLPPPPPLPDPPYASSQPQAIPFHKRTASRESIRSMAFLNSGPPAYNLNYHTPPDSETTM